MTLRRGARRRARRVAETQLQTVNAAADQLRTPEGIRALGNDEAGGEPSE